MFGEEMSNRALREPLTVGVFIQIMNAAFAAQSEKLDRLQAEIAALKAEIARRQGDESRGG